MNTTAQDTAAQLTTLIDLISCHDLDVHEARRIVNLCLEAQADPVKVLKENYGDDAARLVEYDRPGVTAFIIFIELEDYFAVSDTVDELYEQIVEAFEHPALPEYPYNNNTFETVSDYYQWLDQELLVHHPKYRLISFGESYTNDFQVVLVYREDVPQIMSLCTQLALRIELCE
ncbi:hypothetical protein [Paralcaligenes ginsengisoli]